VGVSCTSKESGKGEDDDGEEEEAEELEKRAAKSGSSGECRK